METYSSRSKKAYEVILADVVDDEERDRQEKKYYLFEIQQQLQRHLTELPVVGFNSGRYDVNAMKVDFLQSCRRTRGSSIP